MAPRAQPASSYADLMPMLCHISNCYADLCEGWTIHWLQARVPRATQGQPQPGPSYSGAALTAFSSIEKKMGEVRTLITHIRCNIKSFCLLWLPSQLPLCLSNVLFTDVLTTQDSPSSQPTSLFCRSLVLDFLLGSSWETRV